MREVMVIVLLLLATGCGSNKSFVRLDAPDQYELAKRDFDNKKYRKAIEGFNRVLFEHPGSDLVDDAQYWLAESYLLIKDYSQAREEYQYLLDNLPQSPYRDSCFFKLGLCYYKSSPAHQFDQSDTRKALEVFNEFSLRYPNSELLPKVEEYRSRCLDRLAKKQFETGKLYLKLGRCSSAEIYLGNVVREFPDSKYARESHLLLGQCYERQERFGEAIEVYRKIASSDDSFAREARRRLKELEGKR